MILLTTEERLDLEAANSASVAVAEYKTANIDDTLAVSKELKLAVLLADIVQTSAHRDRVLGDRRGGRAHERVPPGPARGDAHAAQVCARSERRERLEGRDGRRAHVHRPERGECRDDGLWRRAVACGEPWAEVEALAAAEAE